MHFFNLSLLEFAGLLSATSALVVTLYLLNRSRRKQVVATLRFWRAAEQPVLAKRRKRIQQPWSLILQLLSLACLLLAIAQLRLGSPDNSSRDHVVILDTSSWMAAKTGDRTLLDEARLATRRYVRALPANDRVMLIRADGVATPATRLDADREALDRALAESRPGASALNLEQALRFASQVQSLHAVRSGEVVYAGAMRVSRDDLALSGIPDQNLRILPVTAQPDNRGLRRMSLRRSLTDPEVWEIFVSVRNYGQRPVTVPLMLTYGGAVVGGGQMQLKPGKDEETSFKFRTKAAGWLEARLGSRDALAEDDRVFVELPELKPLRVAVFTREPDALRPVLDANRQVEASYQMPEQYGLQKYEKGREPGLYIFDRFVPKSLPRASVVLIEPPSQDSPFQIRTTATDASIARWHTENALGAGLRTKEMKLESVSVFDAKPGDLAVADVSAGPVILARSSSEARTGPLRMVALGFHPGRSALRFDLATPLLFANLLRWMEPEAFRRWELVAGSVGTVAVNFDSEKEASGVRVLAENQAELPHTVNGRTLRFYSGTPGTVRVLSESREQVYSLTLPEVADAVWTPAASAKRGIPAKQFSAYARDLWPWLAGLGALGLMAEWMLFGRLRPTIQATKKANPERLWRRAS
jgi:hypothetical protein